MAYQVGKHNARSLLETTCLTSHALEDKRLIPERYHDKNTEDYFTPQPSQIAWFYQPWGYARFAYNAALSDFKSDIKLSLYDLNKRFNQRKNSFYWTKAQDQRAAMSAVHHLGRAIEHWKAKRAKFLKFKNRRGGKHAYTTSEHIHPDSEEFRTC